MTCFYCLLLITLRFDKIFAIFMLLNIRIIRLLYTIIKICSFYQKHLHIFLQNKVSKAVILTIRITSRLNQKYTYCNESIFKQGFTEI